MDGTGLPPPPLLRVQRLTAAAIGDALGSDRLLALVGFGESPPFPAEPRRDPRLAWMPLAELDAPEPGFEAWFAPSAVATRTIGDVALAHDGEVAFGHLHLDEREHGGLEAATAAAYERIFACLQVLECPHLLRVWHVIAEIGGTAGDVDRYRAFCRARHGALTAPLAGREARLPAASAVGGRVPGLAIQFLASRTPGLQVENPRQVSAFRYPPEYGPRSPAFSRARLVTGPGGGATLLISGTASIVGHRSRHDDDLTAQFDETATNIAALLAAAAGGESPMRPGAVRAYLRRPEWAPRLRALLAAHFGSEVPSVILEAEICRPELLLEIEGVAHA